MATQRITYEGPMALAVPTATRLADADGVELTSSELSEAPAGDGGGVVRLALIVEASDEDMTAALARIREGLPVDATITTVDGSRAT